MSVSDYLYGEARFEETVGVTLARVAHAVCSPFSEACLQSSTVSERIYGIEVRDIGERAAADVIYGRKERLTSLDEVLTELMATAEDMFSHDNSTKSKFLGDEMAMAHAIQVYEICVDSISSIPLREAV